MNNTIQTNYTNKIYESSAAIQRQRSANEADASFSSLAARAFTDKKSANDKTPAANTLSSAAAKTEASQKTEALSLKDMLKAKYPGIAYHVFDASTSYWRTRNDYPHYLLYQQDCDTKALENWKPSGPNPFYGSIDGQFIAPKEIHALGNVPPGSKAVVIHPDVQKRMEEDPDYAYEIMATIDNWFAYDVARNEAIMPGCTADMSQAVAIGKDGSIVNAAASSHSDIVFTESSDEMVKAYYQRLKKRADFYHWLERQQIKDKILYSQN